MKSHIKSIILAILLILITIGHIYAISFEPYDELWNFQHIYKMHLGSTIYSDINVIITPFFYFMGFLFLKIFSFSIVSFRCFNICIVFLFFFILYKIFKTLKVSKHLNFLFLSLILIQIYSVINGGANYNMLSNLFVLLGIYSYLKLDKNKYLSYLQGFIIFLVFFTKQNIGIYYACSILIYEFIYRKNIANYLLNILKKGITFTIPLAITCIIFFKNNILKDFINCTFGGLLDFGSSNIIISTAPHIAIMLVIILALYFYIIFSKEKYLKNIITTERRKNLNLVGIVTIGISLSIFPIINTSHLLYVFPFFAIILFYFLDFALLEELIDTDGKAQKTINLTILLVLFVAIKIWGTYFVEQQDNVRVADINNPFNNTILSSDNFNKMTTMVDYINSQNALKKDVIIISFDSALSMIPLKQCNNYFDVVFNGNLGYNGEDELINIIKNSPNTEFLIHTDSSDCFWQESTTLRNFIIENLEKTR